jgi:hypothetical protein
LSSWFEIGISDLGAIRNFCRDVSVFVIHPATELAFQPPSMKINLALAFLIVASFGIASSTDYATLVTLQKMERLVVTKYLGLRFSTFPHRSN